MKKLLVASLVVSTLVACGGGTPASVPRPAPAPAVDPIPATLEEAEAARVNGKKELYETALRTMSRSSDAATAQVASMRLAVFLQEEKRWSEAAASFRQAMTLNPSIARYLAVRLVDSLRAGDDLRGALASAATIVQGDDAVSRDTRLAIATLTAELRDAAALDAALASVATIAIDEYSDRRFMELADALAANGFNDQSAAQRLRILREYPGSRWAEKVFDQAKASGALDPLDFAATIGLADKLGRANRYDQALALLAIAQSRFPAENTGAQARWIRLRSLFNSRNYTAATEITFTPEEPNALAAEMLRGRAFWRSERPELFVSSMERVIATAPASAEANDARVQLSKYYSSDVIDYAKAADYLQQAINAGVRGSDGENLWTLGWIHALAGRDDDALRIFSEYLRLYPDHDYTSNVLFWSGKIHARRGDTVESDTAYARLVDFYPYSYYAARARELTGRDRAPVVPGSAAKPFPDVTTPQPDLEARLANVDLLLAGGLKSEAARELRGFEKEAAASDAFAWRLATAYRDSDEPLKAMRVLQSRFRDVIRHGANGTPREFWEMLYPYPYRETVEEAAQRSRVEPLLIPSVIRQESAFNPDVVSSAGAVGLMQIMPAELAIISTEAGLPPLTREDLFDPRKNIFVGAAELRQKLDRMNGDRNLAIAAYNAGEAAVGRWIADRPIEDIDLFIETIPYAETRLYVKNVTRNLYEYRRIYEAAPAVPQAQ